MVRCLLVAPLTSARASSRTTTIRRVAASYGLKVNDNTDSDPNVDVRNVRTLFPAEDKPVYFNTAAVGALPIAADLDCIDVLATSDHKFLMTPDEASATATSPPRSKTDSAPSTPGGNPDEHPSTLSSDPGCRTICVRSCAAAQMPHR